ncbi:DUF1330 domain-containing protein [Sphingosinithalassobacter portus]|uniref:DUF1330 domain-containing protein n=1 Tax=Stakelama portus TaxID=2676234 RepID=UPI000D6E3A91|nr:DUF1330 domain-containing protein [Sphingosinithalassobacter portus]
MTAYIVFTRERTRNASDMEAYAPPARASLAGHEFDRLAAYGKCETLEGAPIEGAVIFAFPSMAAARAWYDSPEYTEARKHRHLGADYRAFITEGV